MTNEIDIMNWQVTPRDLSMAEGYTTAKQVDHAVSAQRWLEERDYSDWEVRVCEAHQLMLDFDGIAFGQDLPQQFSTGLQILNSRFSITTPAVFTRFESKGGNTHVIVHLPEPISDIERVAWQAALGSDPKREALHLLSISRNELNPILLYMRKPHK